MLPYALLAQKRLNITKTVRKTPINLELQRLGAATDDHVKHDPQYDEEGMYVSVDGGWGGEAQECTMQTCVLAWQRGRRATVVQAEHACEYDERGRA